jgi:chromosome segregation ATPase
MSDHQDLDRRLARLETIVSEYTERVAQSSAQLEYLQHGLDRSIDLIENRLPEQFADLSTKVEGFTERVNTINLKLEKQSSRLAKLEAAEEEVAKRKAFWRKIGLAILTAIGGAVGSKIVEVLMQKGGP